VRGFALGGAAVALALFASVPPADASFPGENGKIAFVRDGVIHTIDPDGTDDTPLVPGQTPAWSPDGKKLVFTRSDGLYVSAADGTGAVRILADSWPYSAAWSPDGAKIVYVDLGDCGTWGCDSARLYTFNSDGSSRTLLYGAVDQPRNPQWSPDGRKILVHQVSLNGSGCISDCEYVYAIAADGTGVTQRLSSPLDRDSFPSWAPDGSKILFEHYRSSSEWGIYTMNPNGTGQALLLAGQPIYPGAWSPDGKKIAVSGYPPGCTSSCQVEVLTMNADGTGLTAIPNTTGGGGPDWQPILRTYPRPKGAASEWISLVPAYEACAPPNSTHGAPLSSPSCNPPVPVSDYLTVGTADSNGKPTKSNGSLLAEVQAGNPATAEDEADVKLTFSLKDVRLKSDLSDYTGDLTVEQIARITDKNNGYGGGTATTQDLAYNFTVPCAATSDTTIGSSCDLATTADTLVPGTVREGKRGVWQLGRLAVFHGSSNGAPTPDFRLFEVQGIFVP
jgi:hypothetical protein